MNTNIVPDVAPSAKSAAKRPPQANARPGLKTRVQQSQSSCGNSKTVATLETLSLNKNGPTQSSDSHPEAPTASVDPKQTVGKPNDKRQDKPIIWTSTSIIAFARKHGMEFLQDKHGERFAWMEVRNGMQMDYAFLEIRSRAFRIRLLEFIKARTHSPPSPKAIREAVLVLVLDMIAIISKFNFEGIQLWSEED